MLRLIWGAIGATGLGLAIIGAVLPVMPTVPFLIVAAYGFNRSSPRFHAALMNHPFFGPQIREWTEHRAISTRVKWVVCLSMALGLCVSFFLLPRPFWLAQVLVLSLVGLWIATRNRPPHPAHSGSGGAASAASQPDLTGALPRSPSPPPSPSPRRDLPPHRSDH